MISALEHRVERWTADLRKLCDLLLGHAGDDRLPGELRDLLRLGGGLCPGACATGAVSSEGATKIVHPASVKYLTRDGKARNVLYMATSITVNIDVLDRAIQALDAATYFGVAGYEPDDEDREQVKAAYDELLAVVAEHTEMEDEEDR